MPQTQAAALDPTPEEQELSEEIARLQQVASDLQAELVGLQTRQAASDRVEKLVLAQAVAECKSDITAIDGQLQDTKKRLQKQQGTALMDRRCLDLKAEFQQLANTWNELATIQARTLAELYRVDRQYLAATNSEGRLCQSLAVQQHGAAINPQVSKFVKGNHSWSLSYEKIPLNHLQ